MSKILFSTAAIVTLPYICGFGSTGIVGGSAAAFMQSLIGNVIVGSTFSLFQSLGATGIFAKAAAIGGTLLGIGIFKSFYWVIKKNWK